MLFDSIDVDFILPILLKYADILSWTSADPPAKRQKPTEKSSSSGKKDSAKGGTLLDQFMANGRNAEEDTDDVVMNEDGSMYASNTAEFEE